MASSSSGAVPVINEKGERSMKSVKVERYVSGKKPKYAPEESSSDDDLYDLEEETESNKDAENDEKEEQESVVVYDMPLELPDDQSDECDDPRLAKLKKLSSKPHPIGHSSRYRSSSSRAPVDEESAHEYQVKYERQADDGDDSDADVRRRHAMARSRKRPATTVTDAQEAQQGKDHQGRPGHDQVMSESEEDESEEDEELDEEAYSDDLLGPPGYFPIRGGADDDDDDDDDDEIAKEEQQRREREENRQQTLSMIEQQKRRQQTLESEQNDREIPKTTIECVNTDDEEDVELAYEEWKVRELKRLHRNREQKEKLRQERQEALKIRNMSEAERAAYLAHHPKEKANEQRKGKMRYLQRYYHPGAFYLDDANDVLKRDFQQPTLDDRHDKTDLPQAMQVKNFGRSGRTKYTHLADQDTTRFDNPWATQSSINKKFYKSKAGGLKDFDREHRSRKK